MPRTLSLLVSTGRLCDPLKSGWARYGDADLEFPFVRLNWLPDLLVNQLWMQSDVRCSGVIQNGSVLRVQPHEAGGWVNPK